jgi:hypothetical protein
MQRRRLISDIEDSSPGFPRLTRLEGRDHPAPVGAHRAVVCPDSGHRGKASPPSFRSPPGTC